MLQVNTRQKSWAILLTRHLVRALTDPDNPWAWYEVAKERQVKSEDELVEIARYHGINNLDSVKEGYAEYSQELQTS